MFFALSLNQFFLLYLSAASALYSLKAAALFREQRRGCPLTAGKINKAQNLMLFFGDGIVAIWELQLKKEIRFFTLLYNGSTVLVLNGFFAVVMHSLMVIRGTYREQRCLQATQLKCIQSTDCWGLRYIILMFTCFYKLRFDCILKHCFVFCNI